MDKLRQRTLTRWLRQQARLAKPWPSITVLLGGLSAGLLIGQAWLLATLLQGFIVNGLDKQSQLPQFALLLANGELHELPRRPRGSLSSGCQRGEKSGYTLPGVGAWAPPRMACIDAAPGAGCGERVPLLG